MTTSYHPYREPTFDKQRPDMPIILCSGYDKSMTKDEAQMHGLRKFVLKPVNPRMPAALIRKVLDE